MNKWLLVAGVLAGVVALIHVFAGGHDVAAPLLASSLAEDVRLTLYAVWHMVSVLLAVSAGALAWAAWPEQGLKAISVVRLVAVLWIASGLVFLVVALTQPGEGLLLKLPQWILLIPVGVLAWVGAGRVSRARASGGAGPAL
jgi:hypothetical protein